MKNYHLLILFAIFFLSACVPQKLQKYAQDATTGEFVSNEVSVDPPRMLNPYDELFIQVMSFDEKTYNFFNGSKNGTALNSDAGISLFSYVVSDSGYIEFPFIGKLLVKGQTVSEVKESLRKKLDDYLEQPEVLVRLVNNKITILGEVARPGTYVISKEKISLLQVIGLAGDITYYGNRKKVTLIRKENRKTTYNYIDLTSKNMVNSDYFYLRPDDILIVDPLPHKAWGISTFPIATILTSISTVLLLINFFK